MNQLWGHKCYILQKCVRSCLSYTACKSHLLCAVWQCHLWPVWFYHIFPCYIMNGRIPGINLLNTECGFWVSPQRLPETFLILRRINRYIIKVHRPSLKVPIMLVTLNQTWVISKGFRKILKYKLSWKSDLWEPSCCIRTYVACERIDGLTKATQLIVRFRNVAKAHN